MATGMIQIKLLSELSPPPAQPYNKTITELLWLLSGTNSRFPQWPRVEESYYRSGQ